MKDRRSAALFSSTAAARTMRRVKIVAGSTIKIGSVGNGDTCFNATRVQRTIKVRQN